MKKPQKEDFGYVFGIGWTDPNGKRKYGNAICEWETRPRKAGGRPRNNSRPIHPSWNKVLQNFDSTNPQRSQGAFCRWADLNRGTFSTMQCKPITPEIESQIKKWAYIGDGDGLDGSMNTAQDSRSGMAKGQEIYKQHREAGYQLPGVKNKKGE